MRAPCASAVAGEESSAFEYDVLQSFFQLGASGLLAAAGSYAKLGLNED